MDPFTTAAIGAASKAVDPVAQEAAKASANLILRLFGPGADVLGAQWADRLKEKNLTRLLEKTQKKAATSGGSGFTAPRVAARVFQDAEYADNEMVAEYLSGVLASARSEDGTYDGGIEWSSLIARMSSDQLRLHYLIYASARQVLAVEADGVPNSLNGKAILLPQIDVVNRIATGLSIVRFSNAVDGLASEGLIGGTYRYGDNDSIIEGVYPLASSLDVPYDRSMKFEVTIQGMRLFMWGLGLGHLTLNAYTDSRYLIPAVADQADLKPVQGAVMYNDVLLDANGDKLVQ